MKFFNHEEYAKRDEPARIRYVHCYWENIHHTIVPILAAYNLYYSCRSDNQLEQALGGGTYIVDN